MKERAHAIDLIQKIFFVVASLALSCSAVPSYRNVGISMNGPTPASSPREAVPLDRALYFLNSRIEYSTSGQLDLLASLFKLTISASTVTLVNGADVIVWVISSKILFPT